MALLLDTSAAILLRDGDAAAKARLVELDSLPFLSVLTRVELEGGVYARPEIAQQRRAAVDALLAQLEVIDFDDAAADIYGRIVAASGFSRRKIIDRMIAATALQHELTLITCNPADFQDVEGLAVEGW